MSLMKCGHDWSRNEYRCVDCEARNAERMTAGEVVARQELILVKMAATLLLDRIDADIYGSDSTTGVDEACDALRALTRPPQWPSPLAVMAAKGPPPIGPPPYPPYPEEE